ncbi:MAG: M56 family metallopeptidase [Flavobacteriaceae bacterium]
MIAFLIKFSLSLLVFLLFYKLVLEREKMHQINRFLLLFALVFSLMIPLVNVEFVSQNPIIQQTIPSYVIPEIFIGDDPVETPVFFTLENVLWSVYGLGFAVFLFRFIRNLTSLLRKIHESEKIKKDGFTLVLIQGEILPHSFWNYVFVNRKEYENNLIDDELFVHEKTHITQKHSLDILFIEVLQIVFWFHPLVYLYKKAMKLNHEFLADQKVNETFCEVVQYQKLLLEKAVGNLVPIASNLNYSITKKRFIMMTKNKSNFRITIKMVFSAVVFSGLFLACSENDENETLTKKNIPETSISFKDAQKYMGSTSDKQDSVYTKPETRPEFEGGMKAFYEYIKKNLKIPEVEQDVKSNVIVSFIVEKDGSLSNINILRDLVGMEKEVTEMLEACPKWKPGTQNGEAVRVEYILPIAVNIKAKK